MGFLNLNTTALPQFFAQYHPWGRDEWIVGFIISLILVSLIIVVLIGLWIYRDAESRGENGVLWLLIVFFLNIIGLIIWLLVRPPKKEMVERKVVEKVLICPYCRAENAPNVRFCANCGASLE
ncbi:MAG: zinc-ribbon domain-containing protein [Asgard group archaeon]